MTEQQQHLSNLLKQKGNLVKEIDSIQGELNSKKEIYFKVQGIIEYLMQIGVTLPEVTSEETEQLINPEILDQ